MCLCVLMHMNTPNSTSNNHLVPLKKNKKNHKPSSSSSPGWLPKATATMRDNNKIRTRVFILSLINHKLTQPATVEEEQNDCA